MKKLLLIAFIALTFTACKKEAVTNCYHCTFLSYGGENPPDIDYCGEAGRQFLDDQGNNIHPYCVLK